jgi:hypothetical protein
MFSIGTDDLKERIASAQSSLELYSVVLVPTSDDPDEQRRIKDQKDFCQTEVDTLTAAVAVTISMFMYVLAKQLH